MTTKQTETGYYCYVNIYDVMKLPDMFSSTVLEWLYREIEPWDKHGTVDSEFYPVVAEDKEQFKERIDILENGIGTIQGVNIHKRQSLHTNG